MKSANSPGVSLGNSVLITGGSGYLGRELARQLLARDDVYRVGIFSSSERTQHEARAELGDDPRLRWMVGNVRESDRVVRAMKGVDVVIHAAALKRVEVGQENPREMIQTNVQGTVNVLNAAEDEGVKRLVFVSSDKAFEPVNLYGASKFLAEGLVLAPRGELLPKCCVVRYGNVAGSTGSVIPIWRKAQATGRPLRMTDPDCTRFWMTRREAAELVVHAAFNPTQSLVVPDLPAYRLGDLAGVMGALCDVIGLQPGEKKDESMNDGNSSRDARRMSLDELRRGLECL